jgi:hypothetical protein
LISYNDFDADIFIGLLVVDNVLIKILNGFMLDFKTYNSTIHLEYLSRN